MLFNRVLEPFVYPRLSLFCLDYLPFVSPEHWCTFFCHLLCLYQAISFFEQVSFYSTPAELPLLYFSPYTHLKCLGVFLSSHEGNDSPISQTSQISYPFGHFFVVLLLYDLPLYF